MKNEDPNGSIEYSDDGEGLADSPDPTPKQSVVKDKKFREKMDSTDKFIAAHNKEGVELSEEDKSEIYPLDSANVKQVTSMPRNTFEAIVDRVDNKMLKIKEEQKKMMTFEQKKKALVGGDVYFTAEEWEMILQYDGKNKLYEISNKRIKESLVRGIPDHLRGRIW